MIKHSFNSLVLLFSLSFLFSQDVTLSLDGSNLNYESSEDIAGFQFDHNGCITDAGGGDAEANGMIVRKTKQCKRIFFTETGSLTPVQ